ncbi:MAG: PAS domain S-box protein [Kiritimatiellae bacterium]|nr:PAS domain S-box protein [Kiritimatiellia bacterium]MDW8457531.1 PAS domain S-box protein [Verrucomicrobiota bacterium]
MRQNAYHPLLVRQLKRLLGSREPPEDWRPLLNIIDETYRQADEDRRLLERSLELSSRELLQANRDLSRMLRMWPDQFFRVRSDGTILDCHFGGSAEPEASTRARGRKLQELPIPCGAEVLFALLDRARTSGERSVAETEGLGSGRPSWCEVSVVPLGADDFVILIRDISQRRRAEETVNRLAAVVEQSADAVVMTDTNGQIQYVNPAFEQIFGYSRNEVLGQNPSILKSGRHDAVFYARLWETILSGGVWKGRLTDRRRDGTLVELLATIFPVRDAAGQTRNFVAVSKDVTRETELQEQLRQSQKMEAIGRLAGGIAHDFNNLLTTILGNADLVLRRLGPGVAIRNEVEQIRDSAQVAANLVHQLLTFSRNQIVHPRPVLLNEAVETAAKLLSRLLGKENKVEIQCDARAGWITIDPIQLEQVLMNLAVNARDAMPGGGTLTISTGQTIVRPGEGGELSELEPGSYAVLTVSDTGIGMTPEVMSRIFEPFFTTKEVGQGTGLGLSIVYGIVKQCGGAITVRSAPNAGTTFTLFFPQSRAGATDTSVRGPHEPSARIILVADDDPAVRKLSAQILRTCGYDVLQAEHGEEALALLRQHRGRIVLLLSDVVMPKMNGLELLEAVQKEFPCLPILLMSGFPRTEGRDPRDIIGLREFVRKPFTPEQLIEAVGRTLGDQKPIIPR